eukprot:2325828-Prymnesium_polylepis.1
MLALAPARTMHSAATCGTVPLPRRFLIRRDVRHPIVIRICSVLSRVWYGTSSTFVQYGNPYII